MHDLSAHTLAICHQLILKEGGRRVPFASNNLGDIIHLHQTRSHNIIFISVICIACNVNFTGKLFKEEIVMYHFSTSIITNRNDDGFSFIRYDVIIR